MEMALPRRHRQWSVPVGIHAVGSVPAANPEQELNHIEVALPAGDQEGRVAVLIHLRA